MPAVTFSPDIAPDTLAAFEDQARMPAGLFFERMIVGLPCQLFVTGMVQHRDDIHIDAKAYTPDGNRFFEMERSFRFTDRVVTHRFLEFGDRWTGTGHGKTLLKNSILLYDSVGIRRVTMTANMIVGGYAWARFGFLPTEDAWRNLGQHLREKRLGFLDDRQRKLVEAILGMAPKYIALLAELQGPVATVDGNISLGRYLLLRSSWEAYLDLQDANLMSIFFEYVRRAG